MSIKLHARTMMVAEAKIEIEMAILKIERKYSLTFAEINGIFLELALNNNKYAIRHERHPDEPDKKGDEE